MAYLTPFTVLITFISLFFALIQKKPRNRLPPGPRRLPIIGNLHHLGELPHRTLQNLSRKFGDLMYLQLGSVPVIVISSPDKVRDICRKHDRAFSGRAPLYSIRKITYDLASVTTAPYGEAWREMRKIIIMELMTPNRVQSFEYIRAQEVAAMIDRIKNSVSGLVNLSSEAFSMVNTVVSRVASGPTIDRGPNERGLFEIFLDTQHILAEFNVADYFPSLGWINMFNGVDKRLEKNFRDVDRFFDMVIQQHIDQKRPKQDHEDIVDVLLRIQKDSDREVALTNDQIKGVLVDVFIAGSDTSSATIEWTMSELMRHPRAREKVQQEIRQLCQGKARVEEDDLPKLAYLKQVIKESFRLHPPAPLLVPRETTEECTIDEYEIPAMTRVIFNVAAISSDPKYWENPDQFIPERFMNSEVDYRGKHFELLPFGFGRRGCPGINFATPLVELALANLLFCFDWELPKGVSVKDVDMMEALGVTMHKKIPLHVVASPRI